MEMSKKIKAYLKSLFSSWNALFLKFLPRLSSVSFALALCISPAFPNQFPFTTPNFLSPLDHSQKQLPKAQN